MYGDVSFALYLTSTMPGLIEFNTFSHSIVGKQLLVPAEAPFTHVDNKTMTCTLPRRLSLRRSPLSPLFWWRSESGDSHLGSDNFPGCSSALWTCIRQQLYSQCILSSGLMNHITLCTPLRRSRCHCVVRGSGLTCWTRPRRLASAKTFTSAR